MIEIGIIPRRFGLSLPTGGDFSCELVYRVAGVVTDWPVGTSLAWTFSTGDPWPATISTSKATWNVDKAVADAIPDGTKVKLVYTNGTTDQVWWIGTVKRHD